ncbi:ProQ/FINO family protein [Tropicimonas sp. IMCC6043]|uniref:ProQ/FINO family protein n=1 Tax=Tropicimonas sp. IMCC6043 TaxID=2510645 RepID=UPI0013EC6E03|nr:ProQ/FINO family protein [Tropicimonas sp. IMCC6043]
MQKLSPPRKRPTLTLKRPTASLTAKVPEERTYVDRPADGPENAAQHRAAARAGLAELAKRFPAAFGPKPVPLAVGVHAHLREATGWSNKRARRALGYRCSWDEYLRALASPGAQRHDLTRQPVAADHAEQAREALNRMRQGGR